MKLKVIFAATLVIGIGATGSLEISQTLSGVHFAFSVGRAEAQTAQRNTARRTARRTTRRTAARVNYRQSVAGCSPYRTYYNCGGVYYAPSVQNGTTVYIVVNP